MPFNTTSYHNYAFLGETSFAEERWTNEPTYGIFIVPFKEKKQS